MPLRPGVSLEAEQLRGEGRLPGLSASGCKAWRRIASRRPSRFVPIFLRPTAICMRPRSSRSLTRPAATDVAHLPDGATGFTTIELTANFLGTARDGTLACVATPAHLGSTTQVWDATVSRQADGKTIAPFRCTQMILYPKR